MHSPQRSRGSESMRYPSKDTIRFFVTAIQDNEEGWLVEHLPSTSDYWVQCMASMVEICRLRVSYGEIGEGEIGKFAACLFLKVIMNHKMSDGNKRSAVIILYLFLLLNDKHSQLVDPWALRDLAKQVVAYVDEGKATYAAMEEMLEYLFHEKFDLGTFLH